MPRPVTGWWDNRSNHYLARLGPPGERTGKPTPIILRDEHGTPVPFAGKDASKVPMVQAAIRRHLAERQAEERKASGPTVAEVCSAYVAWQKSIGAAERTVKEHDYHLMRFAKIVRGGIQYGGRAAASIGAEDLWHADMLGLGSLRLLYASVLACWRWAARPIKGRAPIRLIPHNHLAGTAKPPIKEPTIEKFIDWSTSREMLRFARRWAKGTAATRQDRTRAARRLKVLCLNLVIASGARPFEAAGLRWSEILWDEGLIAIDARRDKGRRPGRKPRKPRRIPLGVGLRRALRLVERWEDRHPVYVFVPRWTRSRHGLSPRELGRWLREDLKPAAKAAGILVPNDLTLYWHRHAWQTTGLEVESAEGVSAAAGNSPQVLLSTYDRTRNRRVREVGEAVAKRRRGGQ